MKNPLISFLEWLNRCVTKINLEFMEIGVDVKMAGYEKRDPNTKTKRFHVLRRMFKIGEFSDKKKKKGK